MRIVRARLMMAAILVLAPLLCIAAENPVENTVTDFNKDCIPCHVPAKETDWVFIKGYPTLK